MTALDALTLFGGLILLACFGWIAIRRIGRGE